MPLQWGHSQVLIVLHRMRCVRIEMLKDILANIMEYLGKTSIY